MSRSRLFNIFAMVALVVVAAFAVRLALATREVVAGPASGIAGGPDAGQDSAHVIAPPNIGRSLLPDECFDLSLSGNVGCRYVLGQAGAHGLGAPGYRTPPNPCFDVPLSEPCAE